MNVRAGIDPTAVESATKVGVMITPDQIAKSGTEHAHQAAFMQHLVIKRKEEPLNYVDADMVYAIPNGGDRQASVAASLKAEGVKAGVPDLCYPVPRWQYAGLYIEFKKPGEERKAKGGRSDKQIEWHKRLIEKRYAVVTVYGWQAAAFAFWQYHAGHLIMPEGGDSLSVGSIL